MLLKSSPDYKNVIYSNNSWVFSLSTFYNKVLCTLSSYFSNYLLNCKIIRFKKRILLVETVIKSLFYRFVNDWRQS